MARFSLGVNYWPLGSGTAMWRQFDTGAIAEDFSRIAELGLDTVRFFVRWDAFSPQPDQVDATSLDRLEAFVRLAHDAGLRVMPVLFCGYMNGVNYLPAWALDTHKPHGRIPTRSGDAASSFGCATIYSGALLDAQLLFARAAGERLRAHPALVAWDIGHAFSNVCEPSHRKLSSGDHSTAPADERIVAEWSRRLTAALLETSATPVTAGTHSDDLTHDRDIRLASLCAPFGFASMQGFTVETAFARSRLDAEVVPFLAMLAAAFSFKAVLVSGFGNPTCPPTMYSAFERFALPGEPPNLTIAPGDTVFATYPCLTEAENAAYCTDVLERLHADGRLGAYWWCWADRTASSRDPVGADLRHWDSMGIIRADGSAKPVAAALATFAAQKRNVLGARTMPMIASAYYYRTLPTSTGTLFEAFLRHVREHRDGLPAKS